MPLNDKDKGRLISLLKSNSFDEQDPCHDDIRFLRDAVSHLECDSQSAGGKSLTDFQKSNNKLGLNDLIGKLRELVNTHKPRSLNATTLASKSDAAAGAGEGSGVDTIDTETVTKVIEHVINFFKKVDEVFLPAGDGVYILKSPFKDSSTYDDIKYAYNSKINVSEYERNFLIDIVYLYNNYIDITEYQVSLLRETILNLENRASGKAVRITSSGHGHSSKEELDKLMKKLKPWIPSLINIHPYSRDNYSRCDDDAVELDERTARGGSSSWAEGAGTEALDIAKNPRHRRK